MKLKKQILLKIENALESVRPYLLDDNGGVEVVELTDEHVLKVKLTGSCSTCPQRFMTMKTGIETTVKQAVPEIVSVVAIN